MGWLCAYSTTDALPAATGRRHGCRVDGIARQGVAVDAALSFTNCYQAVQDVLWLRAAPAGVIDPADCPNPHMRASRCKNGVRGGVLINGWFAQQGVGGCGDLDKPGLWRWCQHAALPTTRTGCCLCEAMERVCLWCVRQRLCRSAFAGGARRRSADNA